MTDEQVRDCDSNTCEHYLSTPIRCNYSGMQTLLSQQEGLKCRYGFPPQREPQRLGDEPGNLEGKTEHPFGEWGKEPKPFP